jgi:L-lactate utilization protein LutB
VEKGISNLMEIWQQRNIQGFYCQDKEETTGKILAIIPPTASIGMSGSVTLEELGLIKKLAERGNKVFNPYQPQLSREESLEMRRRGACEADYYLASANAVAQTGELVFLSAWGNRTTGVAYARQAIIVCGINKISLNLAEALKRARGYATEQNYQRLNWDKNKPMCCQALVIEAEPAADRLTVILVGEKLGF